MRVKKWGNLGMSLMELTVVLGVTSAISLGFMRVMNNQTSNLKSTEVKVEENLVISQIATILRKPESCNVTLNAVALGAQGAAGTPIPSIMEKSPRVGLADKTWFSTGEIYGGNKVRIVAMNLENLNVPNAGGAGAAVVNVTLGRVSEEGRAGGATEKIYKIGLQIQTTESAPTQVHKCFTDHSRVNDAALENTCEIMGGFYDGVAKTCQFDCDLNNPSDETVMSTDCLVNRALDPASDGFLNSQFAEVNGDGVPIGGAVVIADHLTTTGVNSLTAHTLNAPILEAPNLAIPSGGTLTVAGNELATQDMLFSNMSETSKENLLASIVTSTATQTGTNTITTESVKTLSVTGPAIGANEAISGISYNAASGQFVYTKAVGGTSTCPPASALCSGTVYNNTGSGGTCNVTGSKNCCPPASLICSGDTFVNASLGCNVTGSKNCAPPKVTNNYTQTRSRPAVGTYFCHGSHTTYGNWGSWSPASCAAACTNGTQTNVSAATCSATGVLQHHCAVPPSSCRAQSRTLTCECDP